MSIEQISKNTCFGGEQLRYRHTSEVLDSEMHFSVYLPPQVTKHIVPQIFWLSGLTCNDENFVHKAGAQRYAAEHGIAIIAPDTSPRGEHVPDDPEGAWDFGLGAGFYVNAIQSPWSRHYKMYDYITKELPSLINAELPVMADRCSIMGHSMGGHGALTIALKNPGSYRSVSAFAPICAPMRCPWGEKALGNYLGDDKDLWRDHDTTELLKYAAEKLPLLVDQGSADDFLDEQLKPDLLKEACANSEHPLTLRMQPGYDHSYYFIATFMGDHIAHHASALKED